MGLDVVMAVDGWGRYKFIIRILLEHIYSLVKFFGKGLTIVNNGIVVTTFAALLIVTLFDPAHFEGTVVHSFYAEVMGRISALSVKFTFSSKFHKQVPILFAH